MWSVQERARGVVAGVGVMTVKVDGGVGRGGEDGEMSSGEGRGRGLKEGHRSDPLPVSFECLPHFACLGVEEEDAAVHPSRQQQPLSLAPLVHIHCATPGVAAPCSVN